MCITSDSEFVFLSVLSQEPKKKREEEKKQKTQLCFAKRASRAWNDETLSEAFDAYYG